MTLNHFQAQAKADSIQYAIDGVLVTCNLSPSPPSLTDDVHGESAVSTVESKRFVCTFCGHVAVLGARAGQVVRCRRCRSPVS